MPALTIASLCRARALAVKGKLIFAAVGEDVVIWKRADIVRAGVGNFFIDKEGFRCTDEGECRISLRFHIKVRLEFGERHISRVELKQQSLMCRQTEHLCESESAL